ncbi:MAG TPA: alternative ribosome rescue aminoacyl-tRNA hydrolase ArfB [Dehalococcoidales bacterium]|nr:alternative ribosome rescue aminoacyl-tRNA hydrolase ArfB [Dehalococcoidales bacterium]
MIQVTPEIAIDESEMKLDFVRSSGPGGQNVNKVSSAVELRFDVRNSPSLPEEVRQRLLKLAHKRITENGILVIDARRFRSQLANRQDALERCLELVRRASLKPEVRRPTRPTRASRERRLEVKRNRSTTKRLRGRINEEGE